MKKRDLIKCMTILHEFMEKEPEFQRIADLEKIIVLKSLTESLDINLRAEDQAFFMARAMETYLR